MVSPHKNAWGSCPPPVAQRKARALEGQVPGSRCTKRGQGGSALRPLRHLGLAPPPEFQGPAQPHMWQRHHAPRRPPVWWLEPHPCDAPTPATFLLRPREGPRGSHPDAHQGCSQGSPPRKAGRWPSWPGFISRELVPDLGRGAGEEKAITPADAHLQRPHPSRHPAPHGWPVGQLSQKARLLIPSSQSAGRGRGTISPPTIKKHITRGVEPAAFHRGVCRASRSPRHIGLVRPGDTATAPHASQANSRGSLGEGVHLGGLQGTVHSCSALPTGSPWVRVTPDPQEAARSGSSLRAKAFPSAQEAGLGWWE